MVAGQRRRTSASSSAPSMKGMRMSDTTTSAAQASSASRPLRRWWRSGSSSRDPASSGHVRCRRGPFLRRRRTSPAWLCSPRHRSAVAGAARRWCPCRARLAAYFALMLVHDGGIDDRQPWPVPLPTGLVVKNGSKMRLCRPAGMPQPSSRHGSRPSPHQFGAHHDASLLAAPFSQRLADRVGSVDDEVEQRLGDQVAQARHRGSASSKAVSTVATYFHSLRATVTVVLMSSRSSTGSFSPSEGGRTPSSPRRSWRCGQALRATGRGPRAIARADSRAWRA